jgi:hypothetical protein
MYKPQECQRQKGCCWNIYVTTLDYTLSSVHGYIFILPARTPFGRWELFRMAPRGHVQTLMPHTWERRQASYICVRRGKCKSIKMRVLETERTSSPHVTLTTYIQIRGESVDLRPKTHFQKSLLCFLPSCYLWCPPSNLFTSNKMSSSTRRAWYVRHSQDFPPRAHYMYEKHFHDTQPWPLCCISLAPVPSAIALLHHKWLKRTHEVLNFWNSRNLKSWSHLFKFLYITQLSYKRMFHNRLILRSDFLYQLRCLWRG